jgi:hypothetical protein
MGVLARHGPPVGNIDRPVSVLSAMNRLLVLLIALVLAGCGESTQEEWGGYTESEAKDILRDPQFQQEIKTTAPPTSAGRIEDLYPSNEEIDSTDLRKATVRGEEAWEYRRDLEDTEWCMYLSKDPSTGSFLAEVGPCYIA